MPCTNTAPDPVSWHLQEGNVGTASCTCTQSTMTRCPGAQTCPVGFRYLGLSLVICFLDLFSYIQLINSKLRTDGPSFEPQNIDHCRFGEEGVPNKAHNSRT